jgi:tetratricopeptide (TPR) repeat protein
MQKDRPADSHASAHDPGLMEKYLHSQGAALYDEGRWDEAIELFHKAIALDDQCYTRYHLCLAHLEKKDFDRALHEINRAIELNPSVAKYYYRRSLIWQSRGDPAKAAEDYQRATTLDANYGRVEQIRSSYSAVEQAFSDTLALEWCGAAGVKSAEFRSIVKELEESLQEGRRAMEEASCTLPCSAYCCHFSGETVRHGVHIGPWKLSAIRNFLKDKGLPEGDYLDRMRFTGEEHLVRLIPPHHVVRERGQGFVYYPKRSEKVLDKALLADLPRGREYQDLLWINENSRACAFLHEGKCSIHDLADEPSLPACKEFLCMTGFVFVLLKHLGLIDESQTEGRGMGELNRLAVEAVLILGQTLYNEHLTRLRTARYEALKAAVAADTLEDPEEAARSIKEYRRLKEEYENVFATQKDQARQEIEARSFH